MTITNNLLSIDIGNSTIGFGLYPEPLTNKKPVIKKIPTHPVQSPNEYKKIISEFIRQKIRTNREGGNTIDAIVSSVVPDVDQSINIALKNLFGKDPMVVTHKMNCGITLNIARPKEVGIDRIADAVAGIHLFKKYIAIVDLGTATTITVVGGHNDFIGGAILPGLELMQKSLHLGTAKLPSIHLKRPKASIGKDTISSITSGIIIGTASAVEGIIKHMEKELGFRLKLVLTGGHAKLVSPFIKRRHAFLPYMTFEGLRLIYLRNRTLMNNL